MSIVYIVYIYHLLVDFHILGVDNAPYNVATLTYVDTIVNTDCYHSVIMS